MPRWSALILQMPTFIGMIRHVGLLGSRLRDATPLNASGSVRAVVMRNFLNTIVPFSLQIN